MDESPFHRGEHEAQARMGVQGVEAWARKVVRPHMPEQHRRFFAQLPFLVAAARDEGGRVWASLLTGPEGFTHAPDPRHLELDFRLAKGDALTGVLSGPSAVGQALGLLGIEFHSRRRNRVNGRVLQGRSAEQGLRLEVGQSFGNCPQYIRERQWRWTEPAESTLEPARGEALSPAQQRWIASADTFFIASGYSGEDGDGPHAPRHGMDASHRGGEPGFVEVLGPQRLRFPDYAGNKHFNTIGNLLVDPRVGLLFIDFATGRALQLSGRASIDWDSPALARVPGARRLVTIEVEAVVELRGGVGLRWTEQAGSVRDLRVVERVRESADVTSLWLAARDGGPLPGFLAGQHLPIELLGEGGELLRRTYSLSGAPTDSRYRITVKREPEGRASTLIHDQLCVGDMLAARKPAGDFVLRPTRADRPVVLLGAGVGVTPLVAMLHTLSAARPAAAPPVIFVHGVRDGAHHPLRGEVEACIERAAARGQAAWLRWVYSRPRSVDAGRYDLHGRASGPSLRALLTDIAGELRQRMPRALALAEAEAYLCGPVPFMSDARASLGALGVDESRMYWESFGG